MMNGRSEPLVRSRSRSSPKTTPGRPFNLRRLAHKYRFYAVLLYLFCIGTWIGVAFIIGSLTHADSESLIILSQFAAGIVLLPLVLPIVAYSIRSLSLICLIELKSALRATHPELRTRIGGSYFLPQLQFRGIGVRITAFAFTITMPTQIQWRIKIRAYDENSPQEWNIKCGRRAFESTRELTAFLNANLTFLYDQGFEILVIKNVKGSARVDIYHKKMDLDGLFWCIGYMNGLFAVIHKTWGPRYRDQKYETNKPSFK